MYVSRNVMRMLSILLLKFSLWVKQVGEGGEIFWISGYVCTCAHVGLRSERTSDILLTSEDMFRVRIWANLWHFVDFEDVKLVVLEPVHRRDG